MNCATACGTILEIKLEARLLINSYEQMLAEKLRSLLKFGPFSTRYKDNEQKPPSPQKIWRFSSAYFGRK